MFSCHSLIYESMFFFFKQKTAYEMRISDLSSDVCSSDLGRSGGVIHDRRFLVSRPHRLERHGRAGYSVGVAYPAVVRVVVVAADRDAAGQVGEGGELAGVGSGGDGALGFGVADAIVDEIGRANV